MVLLNTDEVENWNKNSKIIKLIQILGGMLATYTMAEIILVLFNL